MSPLLKFLLAMLFVVTVFGQTDTDSDDTTVDTDTDSTDTDDSDSMDVTGDSDDSDDDDSDDDDSDSMDVTGDSDDSDDDDSDDDTDSDDDSDDDDSDDTDSGDSDDDDSDDTDSGDSDDDDSDDTDSGDDSDDTDSDDDSDDTDSDDTDSDDDSDTDSSDTTGSSTATTASTVSYCASLTSNECGNAYTDQGQAICALNANSQNCYAVVASSGMYGSGNFDDGYTEATAELEAESQKLNAIVGVLAAIVVLLVLALLGGAYFLHQKTKKMTQIAEESVMTEAIEANDDKDVDAPMVTGHQTIYTE